jgi:AraC-like DNA-binding protein
MYVKRGDSMLAEDHLSLRLIYLKAPAEWAHQQEGLAFLFAQEGRGTYVAGQVRRHLAPGDVLISNAGKAGRVVLAEGGGVAFSRFFVRLEHLYPLFAAEEVSLLEQVTGTLATPKLYAASSSVAKACRDLVKVIREEADLGHRSQLLRVAATVLSEEFKAARRQRAGRGSRDDRVAKGLAALSADQLLRSSVGELAAKFGCSERQLNRLSHHYFGYSVSALRMELRMLKAASLLRNPDAKVLNVGEECGFNHLGLFSTCFKKRFGTSPGHWRSQKAAELRGPKSKSGNSGCPLLVRGLCPWNEPAGPRSISTPKPLHLIMPGKGQAFAGGDQGVGLPQPQAKPANGG